MNAIWRQRPDCKSIYLYNDSAGKELGFVLEGIDGNFLCFANAERLGIYAGFDVARMVVESAVNDTQASRG